MSDIHNLNAQQLKNLIERGILRVTGNIPMTRFETPEYQRVAHLRGQTISISQASRDYGINHGSLVRWIKQGIIQVISREKNRVMVDKADVAYCAIVRDANPGSGRWLFNDDGTPYVKQTN